MTTEEDKAGLDAYNFANEKTDRLREVIYTHMGEMLEETMEESAQRKIAMIASFSSMLIGIAINILFNGYPKSVALTTASRLFALELNRTLQELHCTDEKAA